MHRGAWVVAATLALAACGTDQQAFRPASHATGETISGHAAAEYDIDSQQGELADVRVWSRGAYETEIRGEDETVVHVGLEVQNEQGQPLAVDPNRLKADVLVGDQRFEGLKPLSIEGPTTIEPHGSAELHVHFTVPKRVDPDEIRGFRVHWGVQGLGRAYSQVTPFVQKPDPVPVYGSGFYYSPFYDPFYYPYSTYPSMTLSPYPYYHRGYLW